MFEKEIANLATAIREAVTKYREVGPIPTRRYVRVRRRDLTLNYRENFGFGMFAPSRIEEDIWDSLDQQRFQDSVVKGLEGYKSLEDSLGPNVGPVEIFARTISFASFRGLDDEELMGRVSAFGRELGARPLPVKVTAFIDGLSIRESPLVISEGFTLRQPTEEDVAEYVLVDDEYGSISFPLREASFRVVGEFVVDAVDTGFAQRELLRTVEALRLFRVGGIATSRYQMRSMHNFLTGAVQTIGEPSRHSRFTYTLSCSDAAALSRFLGDVAPLLPSNFDKAATEREIAYTRYRDALFQDGPSERAITSAITALEALFLTGQSELTHRLAQRVSVFLRILGTQDDALSTYDNVSKGYKIRSTFIHGGSLTPKHQPQADSLAPVLLEYARVCVLAFFQIPTPKDELLKQLDRAMIDPAGVNELVASLAPVAHR